MPQDALELLRAMASSLKSIEAMLAVLRPSPGFLTIAAFAARFRRSPLTVRAHCRKGRLRAEKRQSGRGPHREWIISELEAARFEREGLLPGKP